MTEEIKKDEIRKDRHRPGYWKERWQKQKREGKVNKKDRHRPGYYREYNKKHPERLARIGIFVGKAEERPGSLNMAAKLTEWIQHREGLLYDDRDEC